jgi:hypothetical protein
MANWWENLIAGLDQGTKEGKFGYTPQFEKYQPGFRNSVIDTKTSARMQPTPYTPQMTAAADKQARDLKSLGGAGTLQNRIMNEMQGQASAASASNQGDQAAMLSSLLGELFPSGGGPNLSGYDTMLGDITSRETALGGRRDEQQAYIDGIIAASRGRTQALQDGVAGRVEGQLDSDAVRRLAEQNAIRNQDSARLAVTNQAREALGVAPAAADLTSGEAQSAIGANFGAGLSADSDARMRESIQTQQYARQLSGLDPMQAQYGMTLNNNYEDRLGALASERAQIQAQRAQAAASYRPNTPSVSEYLALSEYVGGQFGGGEPVEIPGLGGITAKYAPYSNKAEQVSNAAATFLSSPEIQGQIKAGGKLDKATMVSLVTNTYPELFQGDQYAVGQLSEIIEFLTQ